MASRRTLIVLSVVALAMVILVVLDRGVGGDAVVRPRAVVPEYERQVQSLRWERPDAETVALERRDRTFVLTKPLEVVADPAVVRDVLATLEQLSYLRASSPTARTGLDRPRTRLTIGLRTGSSVELAIGASAPGDRAWIGRDGRAYLVDGYAARALDRTVDDLRPRQVFGIGADAITGIEITHGDASLVLSNTPVQVHLDKGGAVRMRRGLARRLTRLLERLGVRRFASPDTATAPNGSRIRVLGGSAPQQLEVVGSCADAKLTLVRTRVGLGCVDTEALRFVWSLVGEGDALFERQLVPSTDSIRSIAVTWAGGGVELEQAGAVWTMGDDREADVDAVREWLGQVRELGRGEWQPVPERRGEPAVRVEIVERAGTRTRVAVHRVGKRWLALRDGEPRWQALGSQAGAVLPPTPLRFRDRAVLVRDPSSLSSARARRYERLVTHIDRGATLQEWKVRAPAGRSADLDTINALRAAAAHLRARRFIAERPSRSHGLTPPPLTLELRFEAEPTAGAEATTVQLHLGELRRDGSCLGHIADRGVFELDPARCRVFHGSWVK